MKIQNILTDKVILSKLFILFLYSIFISYIAYNHELWRDEVDVWLFVKDTDYNNFFRYLRNSGHPGLWHIVLLPFAKLQFPSYTLTIVHLSIAICSSYLLLFRSTFKLPTQIFLLFGYFLLFEYAIVARNYAIGIFILFLIASNYSARLDNPIYHGFLILLLANTNLYCTILALGIGIIFLWEIIEEKRYTNKNITGLGIAILGGLLVLMQVFPSDETQGNAPRTFRIFNELSIPIAIIHSFTQGVSFNYQASPGFVILIAGLFHFYKHKKVLFFYLLSLILLFSFYTFVFLNGYRHAGFVLFTLVFAVWINPYYDNHDITKNDITFKQHPIKYLKSNWFIVLFTLSLIFSVKFSFQESRKDVRYSYSNAKEMAMFMRSNHLDSSEYIVSSHSADKGKTILFYLQNIKKFYFPGIDSFGSYMLWNMEMGIGEKLSYKDAFVKTKEKFAREKNVLFLADKKLPDESKEYELLYFTKSRNEFIKDEDFFLYRLNR